MKHWTNYRIEESYAYKSDEEMAKISLAYLIDNVVMSFSQRIHRFMRGEKK